MGKDSGTRVENYSICASVKVGWLMYFLSFGILLLADCLPIILVELDLFIQLDQFVVEVPPERFEDDTRHVIGSLDTLLVEPFFQPGAFPSYPIVPQPRSETMVVVDHLVFRSVFHLLNFFLGEYFREFGKAVLQILRDVDFLFFGFLFRSLNGRLRLGADGGRLPVEVECKNDYGNDRNDSRHGIR